MPGISKERQRLLRRRIRDATLAQPEIKQLVKQLLKLGGEFVVAPPTLDTNVSELIECGFVMGGAVVVKAGRVSECHDNVAGLWRVRRLGMVGIGTGYALTDDGLWRQHSWGILREGILETTVARVKYFGICLQGGRADKFAGL